MRQCTNTSLVSLFYAAQKTSIGPVKDWESIGDNLLKADWSSACIQIRITTADNFGLWPQRVKTRNAFIFRADGVPNWKQRFRLTPWVGHTNKLSRGAFPEKSGAIPDRQSSCQELFFASNREPQNRDFSATCSPASCKDQIKTNTAEEKHATATADTR